MTIFLRFVFADADVDHRDLFTDPDLRRGQTYALGCIHGLPHIGNELIQFFGAEVNDLFRFLFQHRITVFNYLSDHVSCVAQRLKRLDLSEIIFVIALCFAQGVTAELFEESLS